MHVGPSFNQLFIRTLTKCFLIPYSFEVGVLFFFYFPWAVKGQKNKRYRSEGQLNITTVCISLHIENMAKQEGSRPDLTLRWPD